MIHYDKNVNVVIQTLIRYGYSQQSIDWSSKCFKQLKLWLTKQEISSFQDKTAIDWVNSNKVSISYKNFFHSTVQRLIDVYELGNVMRSHLVFYSRILPLDFTKEKNSYISSLKCKFSNRHLRNISDACNRFLGFLCVNDIFSLAEINYHLVILYYKDIMQLNNTPSISSDIVEGFLFYLAEQEVCSYGFGWYLFYYRSSKNPFDENFTPNQVIELSKGYTNCQYTVSHLRQDIPIFLEMLNRYHYSRSMINTSEMTLKLLFIVFDMTDSCYSSSIAKIWISAEGRRLFKSSFVMARRCIELYEDFIATKQINPHKLWKHSPSKFDLLPKWCQTAVKDFMEQKIREGKKYKTAFDYGRAVCRFCQFLSDKGLTDFNSISPELIKEFNLQDAHKSARGKCEYNRIIRKFIIFLFNQGLHSHKNLYMALPSGYAPRERIVSILTEDEKKQIQLYKQKSQSPLELRDVAICEIGLKMGLRSIDIVNLKLSDIDWKSHTICFMQAKTKVEIKLPMSNSVGNAIYKYIKYGRPSVVKSPNIFLKTRAPYGPVGPAVCRQAMARIIFKESVRGYKFHTLRRTFASDLLKNGAKTSIIADALGHSNMDTVHRYLHTDEEKMRLCPLSLNETNLLGEGDFFYE